MSARSRLNRAFVTAPHITLSDDSRIVLFSDCHRGNGTSNDNFLKNQNLFFAALQYYYEQGYSYIELGDGDELWENRSIKQIQEIHNNSFWMLSRYYEEQRLFLLYGNHDIVKKYPRYVKKNCTSYTCSAHQERELFPGITYHEGIILTDIKKGKDLYLTHGHQADTLNSVFWKLARFLVRYLWQPLERIGFLDPTSAAKNNSKKQNTERILTEWAIENNCILITGHTHRPMLGTKTSPYFNTGSCVHPRCITCIEIEHRCMTLVKWTLRTREDMTLYVAREALADTICIDDY